jgi:hypothetical protein
MFVEIVELLSEADFYIFEGLYLQSCFMKRFDCLCEVQLGNL